MSNTPLIYKAMIAVMREIKAIEKGQKNQHFRFNFRGIDDVYNTLNPLLSKHGVFSTSTITNITREREGKNQFVELTVAYTFFAEDGSSVTTEVVGQAGDTGDKAMGKAMSYAHKIALLQCFVIPTDSKDDPDNYHVPRGETASTVYSGTTDQKKILQSFALQKGIVSKEQPVAELRKKLTDLSEAMMGKDLSEMSAVLGVK